MEFVDGVGETLVEIAQALPRDGGMLVYVPSFSLLEEACARWEATGVLQALRACKPGALIQEPRSQKEFNVSKRRYDEAIETGAGAVLLGVYKAKSSEGISFNDQYARAVVCVGIPFPNLGDANVQAKREWNNKQTSRDGMARAAAAAAVAEAQGMPLPSKDGLLTGSAWYSLQAARAVNQALGRVIRSPRDYGSLILLDDRFCSPESRPTLPKWLRNKIRVCANGQVASTALKAFFDLVPADLRTD